ncbi:FAS1 domain-containing protein like [Verticillium longisporum]|uniref:FAS1 domain-containing protein like n=1 Tax=Verticillium longisporum TaxID=100787 RepID=A0A8I2ZV30_VERLO|nr:FAS1 domain-containing protein like [Verticillium longisporum]
MKGLATVVFLASTSLVASQLIRTPYLDTRRSPQLRDQKPLNMPVVPPSNPSDPHPPPGQGSVILSDVLNRDKSINIFAGFTHDIETAANRLDDSGKNTTILAPLNSAVEALPRKPWEDPEDYNRLGTGDDGQERASRNLRRFVEAHLVPVSPWQENQKARTIGGDGEVWWENKDGAKFIQPGDIEVVSIASTVANGEVWIIKGVRNYAV